MSALFRLTGTYVGFEELKKELETLPAPPSLIAEAIQEKFTAVNMAAKMDTSNLHFLIQEFVKLYREKDELKERISALLESIGVEISAESWGFKGESPEPIRMNAKMVLY
jgi:hypothetical protein